MDHLSLPGDTGTLLARLALATALGGLVGLNREMSLKPAGLRTHALVALGAALLTVTGLFLSAGAAGDVSAPGRVIQGVVAGIGFVGGGVILHGRRVEAVHGLTTAASIWVVSAVGVAAGAGLWRAAAGTVFLTLFVLTVGGPIDRAVRRLLGRRDDD
ncbi:MAG: MgtC/SapB family protein [Vicinamibacterales bacterium]